MMLKGASMLAFAVLFATDVVFAQASGQGEITGRLLDAETGAPIPYVNVSVRGPSLQGQRGTISQLDGRFKIPALPIGSYRVELSHIGYQPAHFESVIVSIDGTTFLGEVSLRATTVEMPTQEVVAERLIDPESTDTGSVLTDEVLESLPTARDFRSTLSYLPYANTSFYGDDINISGSTGSENAYLVEGMNVTDPHMALTGMQIPMNFIRAVEVKAGGYQAEYGRSTGGVINIITHSGSNELSGDVYAYYSNNNLSSDGKRGLLDLNQDGFDRYDVGLSLGGPIAEDRLWFFLAYDPSVERESLEIPGFGFRDDERITHQFAGKLSWLASQDTRFDFTAIGDPSSHDRVGPNFFNNTPQSVTNPEVLLGDLTTGSYSLALDGTHTMGHRYLLEGSVSHYQSRMRNEAATEVGATEPMYMDNTTGVWEGGYNNVTDHRSVRWAGRMVGTAFLGTHELKLGAEYENNLTDTYWVWRTRDGGDGVIFRNGPNAWRTSLFVQDLDVTHRIPSVFLQDSWQAHRRWMVHAGLRWDGLWVVDGEGDTRQSIKDQFQPRVGFTYQPGELGSRKIFGSYGRFYQQFPTFAGAWYSPFTHWFVSTTEDPRDNPMAVAAGDSDFAGNLEPIEPIAGLKGQHFDEFTLGYEQRLRGNWKTSVRGMYRNIREIIEDSRLENGEWRFGNPGRGDMAFLPKPVRRYTAVDLTIEGMFSDRSFVSASYVLSRSFGNYTGVFNQDTGAANPNSGSAFNNPIELVNAEGKLPNDRPHAFKIFGSHAFDSGVALGAFFSWQSGTPLSELGYGENNFRRLFLTERGSAGRAPSIWDLNLRLSYELPNLFRSQSARARSRLIVDAFHLFSEEEAVTFDQVKYLAVDADGNGLIDNPSYGQPTSFQPAMTIRMGIETKF